MSKAYVMMNCKLGEEEKIIESLQKIVGNKGIEELVLNIMRA